MVRDLLVLIDLDESEAADAILARTNAVELPLPDHVCATVHDCYGHDGRDRWRSQRLFNVFGFAVFDLRSELEVAKSVHKSQRQWRGAKRYAMRKATYGIAAQRIDRVAKFLDVVREETLCRGVGSVDIEMFEEYDRPIRN